MKRLLYYMKEYKKESILGPLFKLLEASFELLVPLVVASIVDTGIANADTPYIIKMCLVMVLLGVVGLASSVTAQYFSARAAVGFASRLRHAVMQQTLRLGYGEIDRLGTSTLVTRMTSDINQVQNGVNLTLRLLLRSPSWCSALWSWPLPLTSNVHWYSPSPSRFCFWLSLSSCSSVYHCLRRYRKNWILLQD